MILSLLAAVVLTGTEPSAAALAPRFVLVQDALPGQQPTYAGWTRAQLQTELLRLEDARPSVAGPVTMLVIGAVIGVGDLVVFFFGGLIALLSSSGFPVTFSVGVSVAAVIAVGLLVVGGILLKGISQERSESTKQIDQVKSAIDQLTSPPVEPPPMAPPPAMPFLQVRLSAPWIAVTLARF
ncbi:MAG: hypothetical protein H6Q89_1726 [Myxococcaceae bacterium]|nr:hypothetical protein [Myxococcaceae bacterium]